MNNDLQMLMELNTLQTLYQETKGKSKRWNGPLGVNRVVHWSWWKSWVVRPSKGSGSNTTGIPPKAKKSKKETQSVSDGDEEVEAGMPTPDTPEVLGRYANVAYEMEVVLYLYSSTSFSWS